MSEKEKEDSTPQRVQQKNRLSSQQEGHNQSSQKVYDYSDRFVGSCNVTTDIKEANFFGSEGEFIVAGSDCGCMLLWDRRTTNLIEAWQGDETIVNCVQPHPSTCLIASSGLDPVVRLWSPGGEGDNDKAVDSRAKEVRIVIVWKFVILFKR